MRRDNCPDCGADTMLTFCTVCETADGYGYSVEHTCALYTVTECSSCPS